MALDDLGGKEAVGMDIHSIRKCSPVCAAGIDH